MSVLRVVLHNVELEALRRLSERERRTLTAQAALLVRSGLEAAGLLPTPHAVAGQKVGDAQK